MICWHWHGCCFCGYFCGCFWFLCGHRWHRWIRFCCGQRLYRPIDIRWFSGGGSCLFNELTYNHYSFVNVWLSCCCRCCCKRCDIFTIRFWTGIGCRHLCVMLDIRLFITVNVSAQWKWIGFRIVIDGKWFIAGYFVRWWLRCPTHTHTDTLSSTSSFTLRLYTENGETETNKAIEREREKHEILEKWWKQLVVSHYMIMRSDGTCCFFCLLRETERERERWSAYQWIIIIEWNWAILSICFTKSSTNIAVGAAEQCCCCHCWCCRWWGQTKDILRFCETRTIVCFE